MVIDTFKPFEVGLPEGRRYWEDEATGLSLKRGQTATVGARHARSAELRFALMRNQLLIKSGEYEFAFRERMVRVRPGEKKNLIVDHKINEEYPVDEKPIEIKKEEKIERVVLAPPKSTARENKKWQENQATQL